MDARPQATIVADSIAPSGVRLTTMLLSYWTMIHQDILTHRTMYKMTVDEVDRCLELTANKSTNSNRAKPTRQVLSEVWRTPFCPSRFPMRAATMHSSRGYLTGWRHHVARFLWLKSRYVMMALAIILMSLPGVHKQVANRLLMPWTMTTLVITSIDAWWLHFFTLRDHFMAQDEVQDVARLAHQEYSTHVPQYLQEGEWHLPFLSDEDNARWPLSMRLVLSVARCARTSYAKTHQEMLLRAQHGATIHSDMQLYRTRLHGMVPPHDGPKEHQARAVSDPTYQSGTLIGWSQLRHDAEGTKLLDAECQLSHQEHDARTA